MAFDGLEQVVKRASDGVLGQVKRRKKVSKTSTWVHTVRYADDFVITAVSKCIIYRPICAAVNDFLREYLLSYQPGEN